MRHLTQLLSLLLALALVASACGDDGESDDDADGAEEDESGLDDESVEEAFTSTTVDDEAGEMPFVPTSLEELEAHWAERRAAVVESLSSEEYGIGEDDILRGPSGFEVDLGDCPTNWSGTAGADGDTVEIGYVLPQSGPLAGYGNIAVGMEIYFDYVNANGGVDGKQLELITGDDAYVAAQTVESVDELVQTVEPFSITTLGTPNTLAVYDSLNRRCVPHPFNSTGHPALGDPVNHPWSTGLPLSYSTEAILWGNWIEQNLADQLPVTVGALVMDNDFGDSYVSSFAAWAERHPEVVAELTPVRHDPTAPTVTNEMTTIAAADPDVYLSMTAGNHCMLAVQEAAANGLKESAAALFTSSICKDQQAYMIPAGDAGDGFLIAGGGLKTLIDPQWDGDVYVDFVRETLAAAGREPTVGSYGTGFAYFGWPLVEALRIAAELDGGLTRPNFLLALHALDLDHPYLLPGISFETNGIEDAYLIEGTEFARYDAAAQSWIQEGDVIDLNGLSGICVWDETEGC